MSYQEHEPKERVSKDLISELLIGEAARRHVGVCCIRGINGNHEVPGAMKEVPEYLEVRGENGGRLLKADPEKATAEEIYQKVNWIIDQHHNEL